MAKPKHWKVVDNIAYNKWSDHTIHEAVTAIARVLLELNGRLMKLGIEVKGSQKKGGFFK